MTWLKGIIYRLLALFQKHPPMGTAFVSEVPDTPSPNTVYLVGEGQRLWIACFACPCCCGELLQMSLMKEGRPRWQATTHWDGTVSLQPSVWRQKGCRSHFFLRRGRVHWCRDEAPPRAH